MMSKPFSFNAHVSPDEIDAGHADNVEHVEAVANDDAHDTDEQETSTMLPLDLRKALKVLHVDGVIYYADKPSLFLSLSRYIEDARIFMANLGVRIHLIKDDGLAYIDAPEEMDDDGVDNDERFVSVIRQTKSLTLFNSLVLIQLRKFYHEKENEGNDVIYIDHETLENAMVPFSKLNVSDRKSAKEVSGAIDLFSRHRLLKKETKGNPRYLIRPLIKYVIPLSYMDEMITMYLEMATSHGVEITEDIKTSIPESLQGSLFVDLDEEDR